MKVTGIIAEYNPFHNGHLYQLQESARLTECDYIIVVMSGDFVQRGAPALVDKRTRAQAALRCGADLVLELPVIYATASAEFFAMGAAALLDRLGAVTHLCFGSECGDAHRLREIAAFLLEEPEGYRKDLKHLLREGSSFPQARAKALSSQDILTDGCSEILSAPNNILGIDYIKALLKLGSDIVPLTVKRLGAGHSDDVPAASGAQPSPLPAAPISAHAVRRMLQEGQPLERLRPYLPGDSLSLLKAYPVENALHPDDFSALLYYRLLMEREQGYERYFDVPESLSNRILGRLGEFTGFEAFCSLLKTKEMTYTRISRGLLHILLGIEKGHLALGEALGYAPYAKVLGFRRSAAPLLRAVRERSAIPLVTSLADAERDLPADAGRLLRLDIQASAVYQGIASLRAGRAAGSEFRAQLVIL